MVLESLVNPVKAENKPVRMIIIGFIYTSVAIMLALWIFYHYSSMIFVFLTAAASIPLMYNTIKFEETKDLKDYEEVVLLKEHSKALMSFVYLFIGITLASTAAYILLPSHTVSTVFESQTNTINAINGKVLEQATSNTFREQVNVFIRIFLNNVKVMIFCGLFSFIYGAGAVFILSWNASVIGAAIGNYIRGNIASYAHLIGWEKAAQYFQIISIGLLKYVIHGVPEILAYFAAGLGGGIISIAIIKHDFGTRKFEHIILDSADLFLLSIVLLLIAAVLEVWVTPAFF